MPSTVLPLSPAAPMKLGQTVQVAGQRPASVGFSLGKYREIIIAVAFFLIFDLGVLVLNFYTSFQISEDATAINLAGRQRMLSQRTTKAVYAVEDQIAQNGRAGDDGKELESALKLFDSSLKAFRDGGTVAGGDGKPVKLDAVNTDKGKAAIAAAQAIWQPLQEKASMLLLPAPSAEQVRDAVSYARANNTQLLARMNDLTTALEQEAAQRAAQLRLVQTVGIVLALLNFVFILFKFIRSLRRADEAAEIVVGENRDILNSVREGLFLITPDFRVGTQIAKASHDLFGRPIHPGLTLLEVLAPMVSNKVLTEAKDYLELLFTPHVKEQLVQSINPLSDVQIFTTNRLGKAAQRHLSFAFNRTIENNQVTHLLVTVQDITTRKELEAALQSQKQDSQKEFSMMLKALETDAGQLQQFVARSEQELLLVNRELRELSASASAREAQIVIESVFRRIHTFKGEAQMLRLDLLSGEAHAMEELLVQLRGSELMAQEPLLQLPIHLESLLSKLTIFRDIATRRASAASSVPAKTTTTSAVKSSAAVSTQFSASNSAAFAQQLSMLASDVASSLGKSVEVHTDITAFSSLPPGTAHALKDMVIQLVRNAVAHGIEIPSQRVSQGKAVAGQLHVSLQLQDTQWLLTVRDDGAGISTARIREQLASLAWYEPAQLQAMDERQLMAHIFKPGFSTATATTGSPNAMHAGRGVGLDVVQAQAKALGANIGLSTVAGKFTEFRFKLLAAAGVSP